MKFVYRQNLALNDLQSTNKRHCSDYRGLFETNIVYNPENQQLIKPGYRSSSFSDPTRPTPRPSPDAWIHSYTYDQVRASTLDPDLLNSLSPRQPGLLFRYQHGLYLITQAFDTADTTWTPAETIETTWTPAETTETTWTPAETTDTTWTPAETTATTWTPAETTATTWTPAETTDTTWTPAETTATTWTPAETTETTWTPSETIETTWTPAATTATTWTPQRLQRHLQRLCICTKISCTIRQIITRHFKP